MTSINAKIERADELYWQGKFIEALVLYLEIESSLEEFSKQIDSDIQGSIMHLQCLRGKRNLKKFPNDADAVNSSLRKIPLAFSGTREVVSFYRNLIESGGSNFDPKEIMSFSITSLRTIFESFGPHLQCSDLIAFLNIPYKSVAWREGRLVYLIANFAQARSIEVLIELRDSDSITDELKQYLSLKIAELEAWQKMKERARGC